MYMSNTSEVAFHLVCCDSFEVHYSTNHRFFFLSESAVKKLAKFIASRFVTNGVPRLCERILQLKVFLSHKKFLLHSGSNGLNFANI